MHGRCLLKLQGKMEAHSANATLDATGEGENEWIARILDSQSVTTVHCLDDTLSKDVDVN